MSPMKEKRSSPSPASPQVFSFHFLSGACSFTSLYRYINVICDCIVYIAYLSDATVFRTELKSCRCSDQKRQSEVDLIVSFSFSVENSFDY